jgi:transcriptional regulator with XRE-family HTH domain
MASDEGDGMTIHDRQKAMGNALWQMRKERNLTQKQAARQIGVCHQALSHWERARRSPNAAQLWQMVAGYGKTLRDFERLANKYLAIEPLTTEHTAGRMS